VTSDENTGSKKSGGAPSPRLVALILGAVAIIGAAAFVLTQDNDRTNAAAEAARSVPQIQYVLTELCAGQDIVTFGDAAAFSQAVDRTVGGLSADEFDAGLIGCAEDLSKAAADGVVGNTMAQAGLAQLVATCETLRGAELTCAAVAASQAMTTQN